MYTNTSSISSTSYIQSRSTRSLIVWKLTHWLSPFRRWNRYILTHLLINPLLDRFKTSHEHIEKYNRILLSYTYFYLRLQEAIMSLFLLCSLRVCEIVLPCDTHWRTVLLDRNYAKNDLRVAFQPACVDLCFPHTHTLTMCLIAMHK